MNRRDIRLRKEFLFKKSQDLQSEKINDRKQKLKQAIDSGKSIPTELLRESEHLKHLLEVDGDDDDRKATEGEDLKLDDEYATIGLKDPKVCVTTSRQPSSRLKQFTKEIKLCVPNAQAINRGNYKVDELVEACKKNDFSDIIILNETRGNPDSMIVSHLPFGPTAYFTLSSCVLRHDIPDCGPVSEAYPNLILDNLSTKIGSRVGRILQALYPVPKPDTRRVMTFANNNDFISFRHHVFSKEKGKIALSECGPRFEMQPYEVKLGTWDQEDAESEWSLRPFMNTARKRKHMSS